jgi:hypothetical protein
MPDREEDPIAFMQWEEEEKERHFKARSAEQQRQAMHRK